MFATDRSQIEYLEPRTLFAAYGFMSGKTLEVLGDPQLRNIINVQYTDASKTLVAVSVSVIVNPADGPTFNPSDFYGSFPARGIKSLYVRGGQAGSVFSVGLTLVNGTTFPSFNIPTRVDLIAGSNLYMAGDGNMTVNGGSGNDTIACGNGNDIIRGNAGDDQISVGSGKDEISGGDGNDWIMGGTGRETITGGAGNDRISTQDLRNAGDQIFGGTGNDTISAGDGNDSIWGGAGNDSINAGSGHDTFGIGMGADYCFNSAGSATYYTRNISADVTNYDPPTDKIVNSISKNETHDPII